VTSVTAQDIFDSADVRAYRFKDYHLKIRYTGQTIQDIIDLPEDSIDIGLAALVLAKEVYPKVQVNEFLYILNYMAGKYTYLIQKETDPDRLIGLLNTFVYRPGWWNDHLAFSYDSTDVDGSKMPNRFLNKYLSSRKGTCYTMPMLYVALGERAGVPIYPVHAPNHTFVRFVKKDYLEQNIEVTSGGGYVPDKKYIEDFAIPKEALQSGAYLRTLTKKEYLAELIENNALWYKLKSTDSSEAFDGANFQKAEDYLNMAINLDTTNVGVMWNMANYCLVYAARFHKAMLTDLRTLASVSGFIIDQEDIDGCQDTFSRKVHNHFARKLKWKPGQKKELLPQVGMPMFDMTPKEYIAVSQHRFQNARETFEGDMQTLYNDRIPWIRYVMLLAESFSNEAIDKGFLMESNEEFYKRQYGKMKKKLTLED
jgi:hypothetical protein